MATQEIRARYTNGVLKPMVPMDIEEGAEVALTVTEVEAESSQKTRKLTGLTLGGGRASTPRNSKDISMSPEPCRTV